LPTIDELLSITDDSRYNPAIKKGFKYVSSSHYWSNSPYASDSSSAWSVRFYSGSDYYDNKSDEYFVRCMQNRITLSFDTSRKLKLYKIVNFDRRAKGKYDYSEKPFQEIQDLTQELTNLYLTPRKIKKEKIPPMIAKPTLPPLPKLIKDEYETKAMFQKRVNEAIQKREETIKQLQAKYRKDVEKRNAKIKIVYSVLSQKIKQWQKNAFKVVMGGFEFEKRSYDAETATMYVTMKAKRANYSKKVALKVPLNVARNFANSIKNVEAKPKFEFKDNQIVLKSIDAIYDNSTYIAKLSDKDFKPEKIVVAIKDKKVKFDGVKQMRLNLQNPNLKDTYQIEALAYKDGQRLKGINYNDDIPALLNKVQQTKIDNKKWLFIVGIENYSETDNIKYSKRSAKIFKQVAKKVLGVSERHCYTLLDSKATGTNIKNKLRLMLSEVKKGDTIYFYYNGHGIPDPKKDGEPYMLPSDGIPDFIVSEKDFALKNIYKKLSNSKASKVIAFVDSCFSGATDGVSIIKGVAGSRLVPKKVVFDKSKMVVLTAGQKKQYSNMYKEKGHRMFSYFVMKSLLGGKKDVNMIFKEVSYKVSEKSNDLGALKKQEPTIDGNKKLKL
jgi:hypothetical protein